MVYRTKVEKKYTFILKKIIFQASTNQSKQRLAITNHRLPNIYHDYNFIFWPKRSQFSGGGNAKQFLCSNCDIVQIFNIFLAALCLSL